MQSKFTTEEARFEHASKKAKKGWRTKGAAADAAGVTLSSLITSKFGDADGADPSVAGEAHAHTTSLRGAWGARSRALSRGAWGPQQLGHVHPPNLVLDSFSQAG